MDDELEVNVGVEDAVLLVRLCGELDASNTDDVLAAITAAAAGGRPESVVFELERLTFMDSSGLALLTRTAARVAPVRLRRPSRAVRLVVETSGLGDVLPTEP